MRKIRIMKMSLPSNEELDQRGRDIALKNIGTANVDTAAEREKITLIVERDDLELLVLARGYVGSAAIERGGYSGADRLLKRIDKQMGVLCERLGMQ